MSVQAMLQAALVAALEGDAGLAAGLKGIFDAPPVRAARPYALIQEPEIGDWGTKDMAGREARVTIMLRDAGERPTRLRVLAGAVEDAVGGIAGELDDGWRIVSAVLLRSRIVREGEGLWTGLIDFRLRMLRGEA